MLRKLPLVVALVLLSLAPAVAGAQTLEGFGPRLGFSVDPDQIVLGGQLSVGGFDPEWTFDPSLELGFGDDVTVIAFNLDAYYHMRLRDSDWRPYAGGGIGIANISFDLPPPLEDESDTEVGLDLVLGFQVPRGETQRWFGELRFWLGDSDLPGIKLIGGVNFRP